MVTITTYPLQRYQSRLSVIIILLLYFSVGNIFALDGDTVNDDSIDGINYNVQYDETVGSRFSNDNPQAHQWVFDADQRDMLRITVRRTSGIFSPRLELLAQDGSLLSIIEEYIDGWSHVIRLDVGLPTTGQYRIQVIPNDITTNEFIPIEYSLTLEYIGQRRADPNEGLEPYPILITGDQFPELASGVANNTNDLNVAVYDSGQISQPDRATRISIYQIKSGPWQIELANGSPISRGISVFSFPQNRGIGFVDAVNGGQFFTDQNIIKLEHTQSLTRLTLANGQEIVTDFYRIKYLQAIENFIIITTTFDQHLIFSGTTFDFRRQGGVQGEGINIEPINIFSIDDKRIETDLDNWDTLIYASVKKKPTLRVLYGNDFRILSTFANVSIKKRGNVERPELDDEGLDTRYLDWGIRMTNDTSITMNINPFRFGEILIDSASVAVTGLDGRIMQEPINTLNNLLIEDEAVLFARQDQSYYLSLPDGTSVGTVIEMPAPQNLLESSDPNRFPQNYNNLGTDIVDYHPSLELQGLNIINRANGNMIYPVTDFEISSHALSLNLSRIYNSKWREYDSPEYLKRSIPLFTPVVFGEGWRHSLQYEIDIRFALNGEVRFILPDGAIHIFKERESNVFKSPTLLSWVVERTSGLTGTWRILNGDGEIYQFDRAGRIQWIIDSQGHRLNISPMPRYLMNTRDASAGILISESYGRRFEVYAGADRNITTARDAQGREIAYNYDNNQLVEVQYPGATLTATYSYNNGFMEIISDPYSSTYQEMVFNYDATGRVIQWNAGEGSSTTAYVKNFVYEDETYITIENETVNNEVREFTWEFDTRWRLIAHNLPKQDWSYRFEYEGDTFLIQQFRQPSSSIIAVSLNELGYVRQVRNVGVTEYNLKYSSPDGYLQLVDEIVFPSPNGQQLRYSMIYDDHNRLQSQSFPIRSGGNNPIIHTTQYTYDEWGRIASQLTPVDESRNQLIQYEYDEFGYVKRVDFDNGSRVLLYEHDIAGRLLRFIDGRGMISTIVWDVARNLITQVEINDFIYTYKYDNRGNLTQSQFANQIENYIYNTLNQVISYTDPIGRVTEYEYDEVGNLLQTILPNGFTWEFTYDALNNITSSTNPAKQITRYTSEINIENTTYYDDVIAPNGERTRYQYNAFNQLNNITIYDPEGIRTYTYGFSYDPLGRTTEVTELHRPDARTLNISYDLRGMPLSMNLDGIMTHFEYDLAGNLIQVTDADSLTTQFEYDLFHNVIAVTKPSEIREEYEYDERDNLIKFINGLEHEYQFTYDSLGRLTDTIDPLNNRTTYRYDVNGFLTQLTDARGNLTQVNYDDVGRILSSVDASKNSIAYEYDKLDRLVRVAQPRLNTQFTYDRSDNLIAVTQPDNREQLFSYDSVGRLIAETNALGYTTQYLYNNYDRLGRVIDALGNSQRYLWYGGGQLWRALSDGGAEFEYITDNLGRLQQIIDRSGNQNFDVSFDTRISYSDIGRVEGIQFTNGVDNFEYKFGYDVDGSLVTYSSPITGNTNWQYSYDAGERLNTVTDPLGVQTQYIYDEVGNILRVVRAVGLPDETIEDFVYDEVGNIIQRTSSDGMVSEFVLDERNLIKQRTDTNRDGNQRIYQYEYDWAGNLTLYILPNDNRIDYLYDLFGNLTDIEQSLDEEVIRYKYEYDSLNRLTSIILPEGETINITYNALNQLVRYVKASDTVWGYGYDIQGNLIRISDALGGSTLFTYDELNRITRITYPNGTFANMRYQNAGKTQWRGAEKLDDDINSSEIITYSLDTKGMLLNIEHGAQEQYRFERDALGRVEATTDPKNQTIHYQYDNYDRITSIIAPDTTVRRSYDRAGNLIQITDENENTHFNYDGWGNLTQYESNDIIATYKYSIDGNLIERNLGEYGTYTYQYDAIGNPVQMDVDGTVTTFTYNNNSWLKNITYDHGLIANYNYNPDGLATLVIYQAESQGIDRFSYVYDAVGNLTRTTRLDDWSVLYSYDIAHQLVGERWLTSQNEEVYSLIINYDSVGNRDEDVLRNQRQNPERTIYEYNVKNQLITETPNVPFQAEDRLSVVVLVIGLGMMSFSGYRYPLHSRIRNLGLVLTPLVSVALLILPRIAFAQTSSPLAVIYDYDGNGNLVSLQREDETTLNFQYNAYNRVTHIQGQGDNGLPVDTAITYDVLGRIYTVKMGGQEFKLIYDAFGLVGTQDIINQTTYRIVLRPDDSKILWFESAEGKHFPLYDAQHYIRKIVDREGNALRADTGTQFTAFGEIIDPYQVNVENTEQPLPYPFLYWDGAIYDHTSEYYILGARLYEPQRGHFVQRDPVRHDPINTLYTYSHNRPTVFRDPMGLLAVPSPEKLYVGINPSADIQQYISLSNIEDVADNPSVSDSQMQEVVRLIDVALENTYMLSSPAVQLDERGCDFYIYSANPNPIEGINATFTQAQGNTGLYNGSEWQPENTPQLTFSPFDTLNLAEHWLGTVQASTHLINKNKCRSFDLQPSVMLETEQNQKIAGYRDYRQQLVDVPLYPALGNEFIESIDLPNPDIIISQISQPILPIASIVNTISQSDVVFNPLIQQTNEFYINSLLPYLELQNP